MTSYFLVSISVHNNNDDMAITRKYYLVLSSSATLGPTYQKCIFLVDDKIYVLIHEYENLHIVSFPLT